MDLEQELARAAAQLMARTSGPLHLRALMQPAMATLLAVRAGLADARHGRPAFLWTFLTRRGERRALARSAWRDVSTLFLVALLLDTVYQLAVLHTVYVLQAVVVSAVLALLPYVILRGLVTRVARLRIRTASRSTASRRRRYG